AWSRWRADSGASRSWRRAAWRSPRARRPASASRRHSLSCRAPRTTSSPWRCPARRWRATSSRCRSPTTGASNRCCRARWKGRSLSSAGAALWESARTDPRALDRLLAPIARDLKISLRMRGKAGVMSRLLVAGELANLPGAVEKLAADLGIQVEPLALAGEAAQVAQGPGADYALALGLALRAQQPR